MVEGLDFNVPGKICIVGGLGKMGSMFSEAFCDGGIEVVSVSRRDSLEVVSEKVSGSDVVIVTVPINKTLEVISNIGNFVADGAMITDFTSVKMNQVNCMMSSVDSDVEVIGGHPLFGPGAGFSGQNFILCPERVAKYYLWYKDFLENLGMKVIEMSASEHDKNMGVVQCLTHFSNLSLGFALKKLGVDLDKIMEISTPVYLMRLFGVGRILAQDAELYSDIQVENPFSKEMSEKYLEAVSELNECVKNENSNEFVDIFNSSSEFFGDLCDESQKVTDNLIRCLKEDMKKNE